MDTTGEGGKSGDSFVLDAPVTFYPLGWVPVEEEQTERTQQGSMLWRLTLITGARWSQGSAGMQLTTRSRVKSLRQSMAKKRKGEGNEYMTEDGEDM